MFRKNICDKVSKIKNLRWLSCSFFRADRRGILRFFGGRIVHREKRKTKWSVLSFFKKTKIYENVSQKTLWQSFENEKSETAIFFLFPRWSSWCTPFFLWMHFSPRKSRNKIACFHFFEKSRKRPKVRAETGVKNRKTLFFCRIHLRVPSEPVVLDPRTISVDPRKGV